jgi:hypothetical protein
MRQMRWIGVVGDADELRSVDFSRGLGATTETKRNMFSQELEMRKESRLNSVKLVKRKIQLVIN